MSETATDAEAERITTIEEIRAEQAEQRGLIQTLLDKMSGAAPAAPASMQQREQARLNAPTSVADEIRQQLDERDRRKADEDGKKAADDRLGAVEQTLREMTEQDPVPPVRRIHKIMGWGE